MWLQIRLIGFENGGGRIALFGGGKVEMWLGRVQVATCEGTSGSAGCKQEDWGVHRISAHGRGFGVERGKRGSIRSLRYGEVDLRTLVVEWMSR